MARRVRNQQRRRRGRPDQPGRGRPGCSETHVRVFQAVAEAEAEQQHRGEGVYLDEACRRTGLPQDEARAPLHGLAAPHGLVSELGAAGSLDLGPATR